MSVVEMAITVTSTKHFPGKEFDSAQVRDWVLQMHQALRERAESEGAEVDDRTRGTHIDGGSEGLDITVRVTVRVPPPHKKISITINRVEP